MRLLIPLAGIMLFSVVLLLGHSPKDACAQGAQRVAPHNTEQTEKNQKDKNGEETSRFTFLLDHYFYSQTPLNLFKFLYPQRGNQRAEVRIHGTVREAQNEQTIKLEPSRDVFKGKEHPPSTNKLDGQGNAIDLAILAMIAQQPAKIKAHVEGFGEAILQPDANRDSGRKIYLNYCGRCHGDDGEGPPERYNNEGRGLGPYGQRQPFLFLKVLPLNRLYAGGITPQFAERSAFGVHATLRDMSSAATLSQDAWADLQAYIASLREPQDSDYTVKK